jgi:hypothetical protein
VRVLVATEELASGAMEEELLRPHPPSFCSASTSTVPGYRIYAPAAGLLCLHGGSSPN